GQAHATFAEIGRVALGQRLDELVCLGGACGGDDVRVARAVTPKADVVGRARAEQHGILRYQRERAAQVGQGERAQVDAVERDASRLRVVETLQQLEHGRLAGA